jgi:hypothetical protein
MAEMEDIEETLRRIDQAAALVTRLNTDSAISTETSREIDAFLGLFSFLLSSLTHHFAH